MDIERFPVRHSFKAAVFVCAALLLSSRVLLGGTQGGVRGRVALNLEGLSGIPLTLVNVSTGQSFTVRTARDGSYSVSLPEGSYVVSSSGVRGLSIGRAPLVIHVSAGRFAAANIEMARSFLQDAAGGAVAIFHNPIGCVSKDEFPVFDMTFLPAGSVVSARLYFKSNLSDEWFYTEFQTLSGNFPKYKWTMAPDPSNPGALTEGDDIRRRWAGSADPESIDPGVPPTHRAYLPKIEKGSGIEEVTYYLQVTLADFTEARTPEIKTKVLTGGESCKSGAFGAPGGAPQGLSVLTAGGAAGAPAGFGGLGLGLGLGSAGLSVLPVVVTDLVTEGGGPPTPTPTPGTTPGGTPNPTPSATPGPTATPTPTPTPTPGPVATPTPTPTPTPRRLCVVEVAVIPPGGPFNPCQASVSGDIAGPRIITSSGTFTLECSGSIEITATIGDPASLTGAEVASWSGACSGNAIERPCVLVPNLPPTSFVVLECGCKQTESFGPSFPCGFPPR
jgi:hypothetical protein